MHIQNLSPCKTKIHFIGIGGIGMSALAELCHKLGYNVQGSDIGKNQNVLKLNKLGIQTWIGHDQANIKEATIIVYSTAIPLDNPEIIAAKNLNIPIFHRSELLSFLSKKKRIIAVSGSHGKTTTTAMIATIFIEAGLDPTVIVGGIMNSEQNNTRVGSGEWIIVEADESDGTMQNLCSEIAVVTNIDDEHVDHYKSREKLEESFLQFINSSKYAVVTGGVHSIYGVSILSDVNIYDIEQDANNLSISNGAIEFDFNSHRFIIPAYGIHNASNALLAIGSAIIAGIEIDQIKHGLSKFSGVKRRFTTIGNLNGITFIDDYAHHPSEIIATLLAARSITSGRIIGVIQPHRFSRVQLFFKDFVNAFDLFDFVILLDVYSAGEQSIDGCFSRDLIKSAQNPKVFYSENNSPSIKDKLITLNLNSGDFVIFMGAGTISEVSYKVFAELSPHDYSQHFLC